MEACWLSLFICICVCIYLSVKSSSMNKQGREDAKSFPNEKKALLMFNDDKPENLAKMQSYGVKIFFTEFAYITGNLKTYKKALLTNKAFCYWSPGHIYFVSPPSINSEIKFDVEKETVTYTTTKKKSTLGRAAVGGVLAGGAGAIVGAASSLSGGGTKTVSKSYNTGNYKLKIKLSDVSSFTPTCIFVHNSIVKQVGNILPGQTGEAGKYYTKYSLSGISSAIKYNIENYVEKSINMKI